MSSANRNRCMDTVKGFACLAVVLIHYNWGGPVSLGLKAAARFAVPYFFFVSGFYLPDKTNHVTRANTRRKAMHILKMAIICALIYAPYCVLWNMAWAPGWDWGEFLRKELTLGSTIKFFLSSDPFVYGHFWYLLALLGCYLVMLALGDRPGKWGYPAGRGDCNWLFSASRPLPAGPGRRRRTGHGTGRRTWRS